MNNICKIGIKKLFLLIKNKKISYSELINICINNFDKINKKNNFSIKNNFNNLKKIVKKLDNLKKKILCIPISLKNIYLCKNLTKYSNSKILENIKFNYNSTILKILKKNNFLITSYDILEEFCLGGTGINNCKIKNLYNEKNYIGGSSNGSAISVASGSSFASIGSDTGGSVRTPSSFNNLVGYKPTYNLISRNGMIPYSTTFDTCSIIANYAADCKYLFTILISKNNDQNSSFKNIIFNYKIVKKILFLYFYDIYIDLEIQNQIDNLILNLKMLGFDIFLKELNIFNLIYKNYDIISSKEFNSNTLKYDGIKFGYNSLYFKNINNYIINNRKFNKNCKKKIIIGSHYNYININYNFSYIFNFFYSLINNFNYIIIPNNIINNNFSKYNIYIDYLTIISNILKIPTITIPLGYLNHKKIGFQILTKEYNDIELLNFAIYYEKNFLINDTFN